MKSENNNNRTALITGAASGLGLEFAFLFARDSCDLVLVDIDSIKLKQLESDIKKVFNIEINLLVKDLGTINVAEEIIDEIKDLSVDYLVNNAGFGLFGKFSDTNWKRESDMLNLHINTTTQLTKLVLRSMLMKGFGRILNVSSLAAFQPGPLMSIYYASKAYILSFSQAIANELKASGVTVTVLCPGQTNTSFQERVSKSSSSKSKLKLNVACPKFVAKYGYKAMLKGKEWMVNPEQTKTRN